MTTTQTQGHTQGKWAAVEDGRELVIQDNAGVRLAILCKFRVDSEERTANALRIVQCVNTHESLLAAAKAALACQGAHSSNTEMGEALRRILPEIRAAIRAAEPEGGHKNG